MTTNTIDLKAEFQKEWEECPEAFTSDVERVIAEYWWTRGRRSELASLSEDISAMLAGTQEPKTAEGGVS